VTLNCRPHRPPTRSAWMRHIVTNVARTVLCVSVCVLGTWMSCAETDWSDWDAVKGLIDVGPRDQDSQLGLTKTWLIPVQETIVLDGAGGRMCLPSACGGRMHSLPRAVTIRRCYRIACYNRHMNLLRWLCETRTLANSLRLGWLFERA